MNEPKIRIACAFVVISLMAGCGGGGPESFKEVDLDPNAVAENIISEYDGNSDGELSLAELKKSAGLLMFTAGDNQLKQEYRLDSDGSGSISKDEFAAKFQSIFEDWRQSYSCMVVYKGEPLPDATVTLVPESFMGDIPSASGETDREGMVTVASEDGQSGAIPGVYRIEITHPDIKISKKFNEDSKITVALDPSNPYAVEGTPTYKVR